MFDTTVNWNNREKNVINITDLFFGKKILMSQRHVVVEGETKD